jgi:hypothetical protein
MSDEQYVNNIYNFNQPSVSILHIWFKLKKTFFSVRSKVNQIMPFIFNLHFSTVTALDIATLLSLLYSCFKSFVYDDGSLKTQSEEDERQKKTTKRRKKKVRIISTLLSLP